MSSFSFFFPLSPLKIKLQDLRQLFYSIKISLTINFSCHLLYHPFVQFFREVVEVRPLDLEFKLREQIVKFFHFIFFRIN